MDPNTNLIEQEALLRLHGSMSLMPRSVRARFNKLRDALRVWLSNGGTEPDWSKAPNARKYHGRL